MLFDLHGKRRRLIQVTYATLAILMGGGLVLFGVGSDVQGGLADIFTGEGESTDPALEDRLEQAEETLAANPEDVDALEEVIRINFQLATATDAEARADGALFAQEAEPRLEAAAAAWETYMEVVDRPDDALAFLMLQIYGDAGLAEPESALEAARIVAEERDSAQGYLILARYAALAGERDEAERAGDRAVALAPAGQKDAVRQQVEALLTATRPGGGGAGQAPGGGGAGQAPAPDEGSGSPGSGGPGGDNTGG